MKKCHKCSKMEHEKEERLEEKVSPGIHKKIKKMAKHHSKSKKPHKVEKVMKEFKEHKLHSGSKKGPKVTNPKQAIAIALSEARKSGEKVSKKKK